ncbi:MAG: dockerin type I domain-containing protein [Fimbriimonadales bacterium]
MRYYRYAVGALLCVAFATRPAVAQDPFVYFAGNPANAWFTVGGDCSALTLTANYLFFISGDVTGSGLPARWTALPFQICAPMTFDSIVYMPGLTTGFPNLYIWITGSQTGADGRPEPNLGNILYFGNFGAYPGDPPQTGDVQIPTYYGGSTTFTFLRTTPLNQSITLGSGLYFAIIVADEDIANAGPFDSYTALAMGAPGGPKLYYSPRGLGSASSGGVLAPASWQRFRYNNITGFPVGRILNPLLEFRANDPFAGTSPWNTGTEWKDYHGPALYNGVLGFRNSQAQPGKVTGTASLADLSGTAPGANVEVIFYLPGTKQRVARFSMPAPTTPGTFTIDTPEIAAGTYDVVVRPIYGDITLFINCPTDLNVVDVALSPNRHWLGVRIPNVNVSGTVDLGAISLPNGDANGDQVVDDADLLEVLFAFGGDVSQDPAAATADLNQDGTVDDADLLIVLFNFGAQGEDGDETCN